MKKTLLLLISQLITACLLLTGNSFAQDVIYFDNGDRLPNYRITDVVDEKVVLTVVRDGVSKDYSFGREKVLLAFTKAGHYLLVSELSTDLKQAKQQLQSFLSAPPRVDGTDYLIKAVPLSVIPARISYESDDIVNYKTSAGNAASINKAELVAIFYRDGRHSLTVMPSEAAPLLADVRETISNGGKPVAAPTAAPGSPKTGLAVEPIPARDPTTTDSSFSGSRPKLTLTEEEKEGYRQKSLRRVEEFVAYINVITDKSVSSDEKDRAIDHATQLFIRGSMVEVTSTQRSGSRKMGIKQYLTRLKLLPYKVTQVEWAETQFIRDLTQAADGDYYGTIAGQQTFIGYGADGKPEYSDVTAKNVRVKVDSYQKIMDGKETNNWRVLLGNISVDAEQN